MKYFGIIVCLVAFAISGCALDLHKMNMKASRIDDAILAANGIEVTKPVDKTDRDGIMEQNITRPRLAGTYALVLDTSAGGDMKPGRACEYPALVTVDDIRDQADRVLIKDIRPYPGSMGTCGTEESAKNKFLGAIVPAGEIGLFGMLGQMFRNPDRVNLNATSGSGNVSNQQDQAQNANAISNSNSASTTSTGVNINWPPK